jgi:hypothetical protein
MWLAFIFIFGAIFVIVAGILSGGIFTIILVPLAVIAFLSWVVYAAFAYYAGASSSSPDSPSQVAALPHSYHDNTVPRPTTPDELVDARQQQ